MRSARVLAAACAAHALLAGVAAAADAPTRREIAAARDEVFSRPEFAPPAERGESLVLTVMRAVAEAVQEFQEHNQLAYLLIVAALVLTLLVLVAHIVWTLSAARRARYEELPELPELDVHRTPPATFRSRAVDLARQGLYEEAARELYTALILALDARGDLAYARHKALLDYRLESRREDARRALDLFAGGYHPASFGRRTLPEDRFQALLAAVDGVSP